jgi:hypothetical protein
MPCSFVARATGSRGGFATEAGRFAGWGTGPSVARRGLHRPKGTTMAPLVSVVGCLLIAFGLWGSIVSLRRDGPRF